MAKKRILVIDDDCVILRVINLKLSQGGFEVRTANDGREGLQKAFEETPDLVITDIMMPKLDGLSVYQELKKNPKTEKVPVIFLTALGEENEELKELGPFTVITKPFSPKQILNTVNSMLNLPLL
ncbi:MAG: response regulator [bacterium]